MLLKADCQRAGCAEVVAVQCQRDRRLRMRFEQRRDRGHIGGESRVVAVPREMRDAEQMMRPQREMRGLLFHHASLP